MKEVVLVKLGGAVITNKEIPNQLRREVLYRLVKEIAQAQKEKNLCLVIGNGAGSFAHVPASRYETIKGFISDESKIGMAITQDSAARCNRLVVKACLEQELPAVTLAPSNSLVTNQRQAEHYFSKVFEEYLRLGLLPVTYGDVIVDTDQGCTIWSTDKVFTFFARKFVEAGWEVKKIIHVTEAEGVWKAVDGTIETSENGEKVIYDRITPDMKDEVKAAMQEVKGFDVTGGMWHKLEESLSLTELGIESHIISGLKPGVLYQALIGEAAGGTVITR